MTWWQLLILIIAVGAVVLLVIGAVRKSKVGVTIGKGGVTIGSGDPVDPEQDVHRHCPRVSDIARIIQVQEEASRKIQHIEDILLVRDQMNYAEERMDAIEAILLPVFLRELRKVKGGDRDGLVTTHEAVDYRNCLSILREKLLTVARVMFRENHLAEKTEADFHAYVQAKKQLFTRRATAVLNDIFPPETDPSREDVYEANKEVERELDAEVEALIREGRRIAIGKLEEIARIRTEAEAKFREIIG